MSDVLATIGAVDLVNGLSAGAEVGCVKHALIFTSNFDTSANWAIGGVPLLGPNGTFTLAGSGANATGCMVASLPRSGQPYLGLELSL